MTSNYESGVGRGGGSRPPLLQNEADKRRGGPSQPGQGYPPTTSYSAGRPALNDQEAAGRRASQVGQETLRGDSSQGWDGQAMQGYSYAQAYPPTGGYRPALNDQEASQRRSAGGSQQSSSPFASPHSYAPPLAGRGQRQPPSVTSPISTLPQQNTGGTGDLGARKFSFL